MSRNGSKVPRSKIVIDGRELLPHRKTGIGRFLAGLLSALLESDLDLELVLAVADKHGIPDALSEKEKIEISELPSDFLTSEKALADLTKRGAALFLSPYSKLPLFGTHCRTLNTIHDILYITHPVYQRRLRNLVDRLRLKVALKRASLTWYDSAWSLEETKKSLGFAGHNPRIRHPGLDEKFQPEKQDHEHLLLERYDLQPGYILVLGNGLPHKNLGVLLNLADHLDRETVFVGVPEDNQRFWKKHHPSCRSKWISHVSDDYLPVILRGAFCLAQTSTAEGYGYPPLEAMACGVPAVVSNIPVLMECTGGHALPSDPHDSQAWANAFKLLESREVYQNRIQKGLNWVESLRGKRGWDKHIVDVEELLKEL